MKTSNKLLIALAVSLIIIPIVVIAVTVKMNYKDAKTFKEEIKNFGSLTSVIEGYVNNKIDKNFNSVNIADGKELGLTINLINSSEKGIKIPEELKTKIKAIVDENGILQVSFAEKQKGFTYATIYIYAPQISSLQVSKSYSLNISATNKDSLVVNLNHIKQINFSDGTYLNKLIFKADCVDEFNLSSIKLNVAKLDLTSSNFRSEGISYKELNIISSGKSLIQVYGQSGNAEKFRIDNLHIKTGGNGTLNISGIDVKKSSGSLSDSTLVAMPASILKTMFNK